MADVMEHVDYLSREIGPRPAGTEEEQQAALYITEHMQKEAGLSTVIEDFTGVANAENARAICSALTLVFGILALALPVAALPAALVTLVAAALYAAEAFDRPVLTRLFARGVSQNVVAKYEPGYSPEAGRTRRRKVVVIAHYDSGKARPELFGPVMSMLPVLKWVVLGGFIGVPVLLLIGTTILLHVSDAVDLVLRVLTIICLVVSALPLIQCILHKASSYNDGANCNASGVAVLMEAAARVGRGRTDMSAGDSADAVIHGEDAAREAGLVPEGAEVSYHVEPSASLGDEASPAERLAAAKAAVAALSGRPVSDFVSEVPLDDSRSASAEAGRDAGHAVETLTAAEVQAAAQQEAAAESGRAQQEAPTQTDAPAPAAAAASDDDDAVVDDSGLPAWFVEAQRKAKRTGSDSKPVQRSRYAEALEAAVSESRVHFEEANNAVLSNAKDRIAAMGDSFMEVKPPATAWEQAHPEFAAKDAAAGQSVQPAPAPMGAVPAAAATPAVVELPADAAAEPSARPSVKMPLDEVIPVGGVAELPQEDIKLPSFLTEQPARQAPAEPRTGNRIDVTSLEVGDSGRIEPAPAASVAPAAAPVFVDAVTVGAASAPDAPAQFVQAPGRVHRRSIELPSIQAADIPSPLGEGGKQRAPLAEREESGRGAKAVLGGLPSIDPAHPEAPGRHVPSAAELRSALPSLSGALPSVEPEPSTVSKTGSFAPVGATSAFAPVGDELLEDVEPDDIYVEDADDSDYQENTTETGAYAGPDYVNMPKSRVGRLFGRFRKKEQHAEPTPQQWLDVDDSFDARSVGAARGGWESFRDDQVAEPGRNRARAAADDAFEDGIDDSQPDLGSTVAFDPRAVDAYAPEQTGMEYDDAFAVDDDEVFGAGEDDGALGGRSKRRGKRGRSWYGGAFSRVRMGRANLRSGEEAELPPDAEEPLPPQPEAPEMQKIYQFRNPDIATEVWFVALGAELSGHSGLKAFMAEHEQELRGAIVVELEALGAGDLCMVEQEGSYRVAKTSSRMRRYTRKASQVTGESVGSASLLWRSSASSYAINHGLQAMHLVGMEGGKPAGFGDKTDDAHDVDGALLAQRTDFVMELLKEI